MSLENAVILLVGNKLDLTQQRQISTESIQDMSKSYGIHYFETSAKDSTNIKESAEYLVDAITKKMSQAIEENPNFTPRGVQPRNVKPVEDEKQGSSCSC